MKNPANEVVQVPGLREGLVTALVSENPDSGTEHAAQDAVNSVCDSAEVGGGVLEGGERVVEGPRSGSNQCQIAGDVAKPSQSRSFETMLGDSISDLLEGEVRDFENVSVCVQERFAGCFGLSSEFIIVE